jgi:predicted permease
MGAGGLVRDLLFGLRRLARAPLHAFAVVGLVAFAVGANVAVGSALYALQFKPLPYADGARLATLSAELRKLNMTLPTNALVLTLLENGAAGVDVSGHGYARALAGKGEGLDAVPVRAGLFPLLGVAPALGRGFEPDEQTPGRDGVALLSNAAWQSRYAGDPGVLGRALEDGDRTLTIVGVMPAGFAFPDRDADVWTPMAFDDAAMASARAGNFGGVSVVLRLRPGQGLAAAEQAVSRAMESEKAFDGMRAGAGLAFAVRDLREQWVGDRVPTLLLLQGALLLVLLAVLTNVVNLLLERLLSRQQELGARVAVGARPARLVAAAGADGFVLALAGVAIGVLLAGPALSALGSAGAFDTALPISVGSFADRLGVGALLGVPMLALSVVLPLALAWGFGKAAWPRPGTAQRGDKPGVGRLRRLLVVVQLAVTTVLLAGAGLMTRSVIALLDADVGFTRDRVLVAMLEGRDDDGRPDVLPAATTQELLARARALPGVQEAALANMAPLTQSESSGNYRVPGDEPDTQRSARTWRVTPGYFQTLGIALQSGRDLTDADLTDAVPGVVVDSLFVERHFPDGTAVGRTITAATDGGGEREARIVGVVAPVRHRTLDETPENPSIYQPWSDSRFATLVLRTAADPATSIEPVRRLATELMPAARLRQVITLDDLARETVVDRELVLRVLGLFALAATLVTGAGLYALMAITVRRRTGEIGVRQALGATAAHVRYWVLGQSLRVAALGVAIGTVGALALGRVLGANLYGVTAQDPLTLALVAVSAFGLAAVATLLPARRAARLQPTDCLRSE